MNEDIELTDEMQEAVRIIRDTDESLFITGKAGTGKTTLLRYITKFINKNMVVTASTGIAAVNAEGVTLHSLFCIPTSFLGPDAKPRWNVKKERKELWKAVQTVIIDEISMVRPDVIDFIDRLLRAYRNHDLPFGGVQVVMFGDLYQLPPVVNRMEADVFNDFYEGPYFYYANAWADKGFKVVELTKVFRQSDQAFVDVLNHIRNYMVTDADIEYLAETYDSAVCSSMDQDYLHICAYRKDAQEINDRMLGEATCQFTATFDGEFTEQMFPGSVTLQLREGARVMLLNNDPQHLYCNGSLGTVRAIRGDSVLVDVDDVGIVTVKKHRWTCQEYIVENEVVRAEERGSCEQIPLMLAWATTIHKSQGLTFDKVAIHARHTFCPGQIYVALSRCRTLEGIVTDVKISKRHILADNRLKAFERECNEKGFYKGKSLNDVETCEFQEQR